MEECNPVLNKSPSGLEAYAEVTRRIPDQKRYKLDVDVRKVSQPAMEELVTSSNRHQFDSPAFRSSDYPTVGLAALRMGKLTQEQFGSLMLYWQATEYHTALGETVEAWDLFDSQGHMVPQVYSAINSTFPLGLGLGAWVGEWCFG